MNAESIRTLIINNPRTRDGYTKPVRDAVANYAQARRTEGASWAAIEAEIDVSATSMRRWIQEPSEGGFHQVVVVDHAGHDLIEPDGAELTITTPSGFTLTGFTLDQATLLLGRLR